MAKERLRSQQGGGQDRIDKQHARGSLTARERLDLLFDTETFCEMDALKVHRCQEFGMNEPENLIPGDGVVTGHGLVNGRQVFAFSQVSLNILEFFFLIGTLSNVSFFLGIKGLYRLWREFE